VSETIQVYVNGEPRQVAGGTTVAALVGQLGFDARTLLVEFNGEPLARDRWGSTALAGGDKLELFRVSAGG